MTQLRCLIWSAVSSRAQNEPDKISLPQQEADARAIALRYQWDILDILRVPGHSRRYIDFHRLAADAARQGIDAFLRLEQHWEARDFDVLVVLDGNRFARTQALHAYITERTINGGARIYSLTDGWVDKQNYRMWIAMNGYRAAGEIDRFVASRDRAMTARAQRGLPITSRIPISHRVVRDPQSGKALRLEVDEGKRRLWDDLAELILEGVCWDGIEGELYERFGHVSSNGEAYYSGYMYRLIMKPLFWGHMARFHANSMSKNGYRYGRWIYDETEPVPNGVLMFRNTHPAVWQGELADRICQEIDRRSENMRGKASSGYTHRLSGLAICGECGSFMSTRVDDGYRGLYCPNSKGRSGKPKCDNRGVVSENKIISRLNEFLAQMLRESTTNVFEQPVPDTSRIEERTVALDTEIGQLEEQARIFIRKQLTAGEDIQSLYDEELGKINDQLKKIREAKNRLQGESLVVQHTNVVQQATLEELADLTLESFWLQQSRVINQMLHRVLGRRRLVILGGKVIGVAEVRRTQRRRN